jgi:formyltetrahydrofolate hydrolase
MVYIKESTKKNELFQKKKRFKTCLNFVAAKNTDFILLMMILAQDFIYEETTAIINIYKKAKM